MFKKLGIQLYTVREHLGNADEIRDTFRKLKAMGYDQGQTAGLTIPFDEYGKIAAEENFEIVGTHEDLVTLYNDTEKAIIDHKAINTKFMGIGGMPGEYYASREKTLEFCEMANAICERIKPHGMKFTYHNHAGEFKKFGNETMMDILINNTDPEIFSFCLDTFWVQYGGGDVRHWLEKLAGRVHILHLKDMGVIDHKPTIVEVGNGNLWWSEILKVAESTGVQYIVVEQDTGWMNGNALESAKISADYLAQYLDK